VGWTDGYCQEDSGEVVCFQYFSAPVRVLLMQWNRESSEKHMPSSRHSALQSAHSR
jgi:hypothetical protein